VSRDATAARRSAYRRGRRGEGLALLWLRLRGYRILARDLRSPAGEIDIVARRGRILAIIEVKARDATAAAIGAASARQRARIVRAARLFVGRHPRLAHLTVRFDLMLVTADGWPRHLTDAWRADDGA